ncbi:MAG: zinc ribbon domain-containing protein [Opitutaceae bacterium]|nr:zinc ribbon domain-containing protein [Opitutaceae bacterium]MBP9912656.1 zinc ribbon domain-containing protein [Opitutaceae bacterium]
MPSPPSECPVCGAAVPPQARACPECGADERSGWNEESTRYDGLDLPAEAFDDEQTAPRSNPRNMARHWWLVALVLIVLSLLLVLN